MEQPVLPVLRAQPVLSALLVPMAPLVLKDQQV